MNEDIIIHIDETIDSIARPIWEARELREQQQWGFYGSHGKRNNDGGRCHRMGALAEAAIARYLGLWWSGDSKDNPELAHGLDYDIYPNIQVRSSENSRCFIIRPRDIENHYGQPYIVGEWLDKGINNILVIKGWLVLPEGCKKEYFTKRSETDTRPPAYFIPYSELRDIATFKEWQEYKIETRKV